MGSDWGEFWRRILRLSWFGHQSLFDIMPKFVVPCTTGHLPALLSACASMFPSDRVFSSNGSYGTHLDQSASSAFCKRPTCDFPALASVSNQSAISSKPSWRAARAMPGYMSVYSWVSLAIAALRLSPVGPIGLPVAGSPTSSRYSRWPCACPVSPSAVERNTAATSLKPSTCPGWVNRVGLHFRDFVRLAAIFGN